MKPIRNHTDAILPHLFAKAVTQRGSAIVQKFLLLKEISAVHVDESMGTLTHALRTLPSLQPQCSRLFLLRHGLSATFSCFESLMIISVPGESVANREKQLSGGDSDHPLTVQGA